MKIVVSALTTGIDAAVFQAQQTAQQQFQPHAQPQQFQTTLDDEQSVEGETDQHRCEQERQRHLAIWCSNRCFTFNTSMQPFVIVFASDSAEERDTVACHRPMSNSEARTDCQHTSTRGAPCLRISSPICIHSNMDDVVQLPNPREVQDTPLTAFVISCDSLQFCL